MPRIAYRWRCTLLSACGLLALFTKRRHLIHEVVRAVRLPLYSRLSMCLLSTANTPSKVWMKNTLSDLEYLIRYIIKFPCFRWLAVSGVRAPWPTGPSRHRSPCGQRLLVQIQLRRYAGMCVGSALPERTRVSKMVVQVFFLALDLYNR